MEDRDGLAAQAATRQRVRLLLRARERREGSGRCVCVEGFVCTHRPHSSSACVWRVRGGVCARGYHHAVIACHAPPHGRLRCMKAARRHGAKAGPMHTQRHGAGGAHSRAAHGLAADGDGLQTAHSKSTEQEHRARAQSHSTEPPTSHSREPLRATHVPHTVLQRAARAGVPAAETSCGAAAWIACRGGRGQAGSHATHPASGGGSSPRLTGRTACCDSDKALLGLGGSGAHRLLTLLTLG
jgi:hypothetical protein